MGAIPARIRIFPASSGKLETMSWDVLGDEVRKRRRALGLTQVEITARGGPSVETLSALERKRAGRLSRQSRRALERALEWAPGSIDDVLAGGHPQPLGDADITSAAPITQDEVAEERFAVAGRVIEMKRTLAQHREGMSDEAVEALREEVAQAAREVEAVIIKMLPWLSDEERGQAIRILAQLRGDE